MKVLQLKEGATGKATYFREYGEQSKGQDALAEIKMFPFTVIKIRSKDFIIQDDKGKRIYCTLPKNTKQNERNEDIQSKYLPTGYEIRFRFSINNPQERVDQVCQYSFDN